MGVFIRTPNKFEGQKNHFLDFKTKIDTLSTTIPLDGKNRVIENNRVHLWLGEDVHTRHGGGPPPTSEIGCPLGVWGWGR